MSALCVITKLHNAGHKVVGCDIYPKEWHYETSLCDIFVQAPYANTKEYIPFLIELAKKENYLIDINPRFSAGIAFSCKTGYDFINAHLACFSGSPIPPAVEFIESIEIKYFIENTTDSST